MLAHSSHVARITVLALALLVSIVYAKASGTVHVRDEPRGPDLLGNVNFKYVPSPLANYKTRPLSSARPFAHPNIAHATPAMSSTAPTLQISEQELKNLLGINLELDLSLEVVHDTDDAVAQTRSVGRIPVHIKVHELTIGGILAPSLNVKDVNLQTDPVNYGNIRVI
ncbi:hypothetical protein BGZ52_006753 [Haplosporangium bisporale]|nr:hypothetical protein BGZ52_006753 [Haplosporangium bisporale]